MEDLTPEELEAILGTDYETVLADILRRKESAESRRHDSKPVGQLANGHVFFDPGGIAMNLMGQYQAKKDATSAQADLDRVLGEQKAGRRTYAEALTRKPPQPAVASRSVDSTVPGQAPAPVPGAPPMAPGAPPALANASQMSPDRLAKAGTPPHVMALLAKLRGQ